MTECSSPEKLFQDDFFPNVKSRRVEVDFNGGIVSSDGGVLLLKQVERKIRLLGRASKIHVIRILCRKLARSLRKPRSGQ